MPNKIQTFGHSVRVDWSFGIKLHRNATEKCTYNAWKRELCLCFVKVDGNKWMYVRVLFEMKRHVEWLKVVSGTSGSKDWIESMKKDTYVVTVFFVIIKNG